MVWPYAFFKVLKKEEPYLDSSGRMPKEQAEFLMQDSNMEGKYLGACLDSCRWGSMTTVMYEMNIKEMIGFITNWMRQNQQNFTELWHEKKIEERYKKFELPFINHESCPRDKNHSGTLVDLAGRLRCAHKSEKKLKPSVVDCYSHFDELSGMSRQCFYETAIQNPVPEDAWDEKTGELDPHYKKEWENYQKELENFENEEPSFLVDDVCYAILSEGDRILPLETILKRLNLRPETETVWCKNHWNCERKDELSEQERALYGSMCLGHVKPNRIIEFPFDGWDLAFYVQKWHQQAAEGMPLIFEQINPE